MAIKIKIALFGLCFANSIVQPAYAYHDDKDKPKSESGEQSKKESTASGGSKKGGSKKVKHKRALIKVSNVTVAMTPSIVYKGDEIEPKNDVQARVTLKSKMPGVWGRKNAKAEVNIALSRKELLLRQATVTIANCVTIGYGGSILNYEKASPLLPISTDATVLQVKYMYALDWFRMRGAIESPVELKTGLFDKNKSDSSAGGDEDKSRINRLDDLKDKKRTFNIKNRIPAIGLSLGVVDNRLNIGVSGLLRITDYTNSADSDPKKSKNHMKYTWGSNVGVQYQIMPKKLTVTGQGVYVAGLGDYVSGLAAIQADPKREEMCAVYYSNSTDKKDKKSLVDMGAYGAGGTVEYSLTRKWTVAVLGSYLAMLKDEGKPGSAFKNQWNVGPKVEYKMGQYLSVAAGYGVGQENKVDQKKEKKIEHKVFGNMKFTFNA